MHPISKNNAYLVSPPLLSTPIIINVLNVLRAISIPIITNIFLISGISWSDTLNNLINPGIDIINKSPNIAPTSVTNMANFLE